MKKILILSLVMVGFVTEFYGQTLSEFPNFKRYEADNVTAMAPEAIFIGNSITEQWYAKHPDFFKENKFFCRGIGGQTAPQMLLRFQRDVVNLRPVAVVINAGINDIAENTGAYSQAYTFDCIRSMAEIAEANGIRVILTSVMPAGKFPWRESIEDVPAKIDSLNKLIKEYAARKGFTYVDYNTPLRAADGSMIPEYTTDGVHLTSEGYDVIEKVLLELFQN